MSARLWIYARNNTLIPLSLSVTKLSGRMAENVRPILTEASTSSDGNNTNVYDKALEHWSSAASNVNGMLGGFSQLHAPDINASRQFIAHLKNSNYLLNFGRALDCGSGIGRVTKHLLLPLFQKVDMVDFAENFIQNSREYIGEEAFARVGNQYVDSLHTFEPVENFYNVIWIQWVSGHLMDEDFVRFMKRCKVALKPGGLIVVKDNIVSAMEKVFDYEDHSWTRPKHELHVLFKKSGLELLADRKQLNFPKGMYEVRMFALRPMSRDDVNADNFEKAENSV